MVFVTARLTRNSLPLGIAIQFDHVYDIGETQTAILGNQLRVVCQEHYMNRTYMVTTQSYGCKVIRRNCRVYPILYHLEP